MLEAGEWALLGVVPSVDPATADDRGPSTAVHRLLDMLGLAPTERTVVTPTCGLAGAPGVGAPGADARLVRPPTGSTPVRKIRNRLACNPAAFPAR